MKLKSNGNDIIVEIESVNEIANEIEIAKHEIEIEDGHDITIEIADESPTTSKSPTDDKPPTESLTESINGNSTANEIEDVQETNVRERTINDEFKTREVNGMKRIESKIPMNPNL